MGVMDARRRLMMAQTAERWDFVLVKTSQQQSVMLDVIEGQSITVQWETPADITPNLNGWVLNGYDCCSSIRQVRDVGRSGEQILQITQSGQVRVGGYVNNQTFGLATGSIVRIRFN